MYDFKIVEQQFVIDGKPQLLLCGEIHYFRIPKKQWAIVLDRLVECGCNAVAYYVPWFVHEYEEGEFDFDGLTHPENDLKHWLTLTMEKGLLAFFRPGPYIYSESSDLGIPKWFTAHYPDAQVKGYVNGKLQNTSRVNCAAHNHPNFLQAVERWYRAVCAQARPYLAPKGNIVLFQLCNEIPADDTDDRNPVTLGIGSTGGIFPQYLAGKYRTVEQLNQSYCARFTALETVEPHMLEKADKGLANEDHLEFYYGHYYPTYFNRLTSVVRQQGIGITLVHNAYNPRAVSLHYHNKQKNPQLCIGVDNYYSLSGRIGLRDATYFCEYGAEYSRRFLGNLPWVVEQECGYWHDYPAVYGPELYIWNIWTAAAGYRGFNLYLFAGGTNRPGMGFYGTDHNWQAPVAASGETNERYNWVRRSLEDLKKDSAKFLAPLRYDITLGVKNDYGLIWRPVAKATDGTYFALKTAGFTPQICDFMRKPLEELQKKPALWVVSDEVMDCSTQQKLCDYAAGGGKLILGCRVPLADYEGKPCTVLAERLGISAASCPIEEDDQQKMTMEQIEYFIGKTVQPVTVPEKWVIAREQGGGPAAAVLPYGLGEVCLLPFPVWVQFSSTAHALAGILARLGIWPLISGAQQLRLIPKADGGSIALNLHPIPVNEQVLVDGISHSITLAPHSYCLLASAPEELL